MVSEGYPSTREGKIGRGAASLRAPSATHLGLAERVPPLSGYTVCGDLLPARWARMRDLLGDICASQRGVCRARAVRICNRRLPQ